MKEYSIRLINYYVPIKSTIITLTSTELRLIKNYGKLEEVRTYLREQEGLTLIGSMCSIWSLDLGSQRKYKINP